MDFTFATALILMIFVVGYMVIILELYTKVNKSATAIGIAFLTWLIYFVANGIQTDGPVEKLSEYLGEVSQILFFLLGAMTLVELIDVHRGFQVITEIIYSRSKRTLLVIISILTFFLSAILDNLTTTILMISILRKLIPSKEDRLLPLCMVVIAANAGGAWTPIGDVTTTMLWIDNKVSTAGVIGHLLIPSLVCLLIPLIIYLFMQKGQYPAVDLQFEKPEPGSKIVFYLGIGSLIAVPLIKSATGLPPFMGVLFGLALLWIVTDIIHWKFEERKHLRVSHVLTRIDSAGILFFLGILLSVDALDSVGILQRLSLFLSENLESFTSIATAIGLLSAVVDNVPIVAASMGMYTLPTDHTFWLLVAFTAGTGGSILLIGSAAGVALMGIEKVDFIEYMKKASIPALLGFLGGIGAYLAMA